MSFLYKSPNFSPNVLSITTNNLINNDINQMKNYIIELEQNIQNQQLDIINLKNCISNLEHEKLILNQKYEKQEITLTNLSAISENLKLKTNEYENKISELEKINTSLNYNNIELSQKNKSFSNINETIIKSKNISQDLLSVYEKLEEAEIIKNKLEFDNKKLINQLNDIQNNYSNEINLLNKIKNNEIEQLNKIILTLNNNLSANLEKNSFEENSKNDINNNLNNNSQLLLEQVTLLENKVKDLNEKINDLQNENKILKEQIIENKNKLINEIKYKTDSFEENNLKNENIIYSKETENQMEKLIFERDDILNKYNELKINYDKFNLGLKEANNLFIEKTLSFNKVLNSYNNKMTEYKLKIKQLKIKINELIDENLNLKSKIYNKFPKNNLFYNNEQGNFFNIRKKLIQPLNQNKILDNKDPYSASQHKSLDLFRNILLKVDESLKNNKEFFSLAQD